MSSSNELQTLIYNRLVADVGVYQILAGRILDRIDKVVNGAAVTPVKDADFPYMSFGPSDVVEDDSECVTGVVETIQLDVWSRYTGGYQECKNACAAIKKSLHLPTDAADLGINALVELRVNDIRYFADSDGLTRHGVVIVQAIMEEN